MIKGGIDGRSVETHITSSQFLLYQIWLCTLKSMFWEYEGGDNIHLKISELQQKENFSALNVDVGGKLPQEICLFLKTRIISKKGEWERGWIKTYANALFIILITTHELVNSYIATAVVSIILRLWLKVLQYSPYPLFLNNFDPWHPFNDHKLMSRKNISGNFIKSHHNFYITKLEHGMTKN